MHHVVNVLVINVTEPLVGCLLTINCIELSDMGCGSSAANAQPLGRATGITPGSDLRDSRPVS
jgi:hypothetical protein